MHCFDYNRPSVKADVSNDLVASLTDIFAPCDVYVVEAEYLVTFSDVAYEVWVTRTAIRNHQDTLRKIRESLCERGTAREWVRDGYVIAVDRFAGNTTTVIQSAV
jgi:hypothetical protein